MSTPNNESAPATSDTSESAETASYSPGPIFIGLFIGLFLTVLYGLFSDHVAQRNAPQVTVTVTSVEPRREKNKDGLTRILYTVNIKEELPQLAPALRSVFPSKELSIFSTVKPGDKLTLKVLDGKIISAQHAP